MTEFKLKSGNVLKISNIPFADANALYQAALKELKQVKLESKAEFGNAVKDLFCLGFASREMQALLWEIFKRCQYCDKRGELKIDKDTFEPLEARADYMEVSVLVIKDVIGPFLNGLFAEYKTLFEVLGGALA